MKSRHQLSRAAVELIKRFEGYRADAAQLADGRWTIGYGHTLTAREGAHVSADDAEALLQYDLIAVSHAVNEHSYTPLNQNQFDALASFAFNIGVENFRRSAVLRRINEGALIQAACSMEMWRKADFAGERIVIDALVRRRSAEKNLFLTPPDGWIAAPSPILPPKVDYDASYAVPRQAPSPVTASLEGDRAEARLDMAHAPVPVPPDEDEEPTASERAAAAVSARLESLLPEETPEETVEAAPHSEPLLAPPPPVEAGAFDVPPIPDAEPPLPDEPAAQAAAWPSPYVAPTPEEQGELDAQALPEEAPSDEGPAESQALPEAEAPSEAASEPLFELSPEPPPSAEPDPAEPETAPADSDSITLDRDTLFDAPPAPQTQSNAPWNLSLSEDRGVVSSFEPALPLDAKPGSTKAAPLAVLAVVSLVFFAGGVFGGLNAASDTSGAFLTAKAISWMLCVVGAVGFVIAAYLLLRLLDAPED